MSALPPSDRQFSAGGKMLFSDTSDNKPQLDMNFGAAATKKQQVGVTFDESHTLAAVDTESKTTVSRIDTPADRAMAKQMLIEHEMALENQHELSSKLMGCSQLGTVTGSDTTIQMGDYLRHPEFREKW